MFKLLKEKISKWAKKVSEKETKEVSQPKKEQKKEEIKEISLPLKFNVGAKKYEPDLEKFKETAEEIEEEEEEEKESFFKKIKTKVSKIKISEKDFDIYAEELKMLLLENNVALEVTEKIIKELKEKIIGKELLKKELEEEIKDIFKEIIREILIAPPDLTKKIKEKLSDQSKDPYIILFCVFDCIKCY